MLSERLRVLYLHGFASSPASRKASFFAEKLSAEGVPFEAPAMDQGDFEKLTITGQLNVVSASARGEPVVLIGSSLGGYVAGLYAARHANVQRLVLLAPAFQFHRRWTTGMDPQALETWRRNGTMSIFHYGLQRDSVIGYQLIEDAAHYEPWPDFRQPVLIFHGTEDTAVPVEYSAEFARSHPNARLFPMNSGHELIEVLDEVWNASNGFLLGVGT